MRILAALTATFVPAFAFAHTGHGEGSGLASGLLHPLTGIDHLLAIGAAGLLAGLMGGRAPWLLPLAFLAAMLAGAGLAAAGVELPLVETLILLSVVCLGALAACGITLPVAAGLAAAGFFALFHGAAHGAEAPLSGSLPGYMLGFTVSTGLLLAFGAIVGRASPNVAARFAGAAVAVCGVVLALPV